MIVNLTTYVGWDPQQTLLSVIARPQMQGWLHDYLSYDPNNLSLYYLFVFVKNFCSFVHLPFSMLVINYFNMIIIDIAFLFLIIAIKILTNSKTAPLFGLITISTLLGFSPWIIVTYTDTICLLPVSLGILSLALLIKKSNYYAAVILGIAGSCSFFVKPSSCIYYIAAVIILITFQIIYKTWKNIPIILTTILATFLVTSGLHFFNTHQTMYPIDPSLATSPTQYLMMGAQGNGGYNLQDVLSNINDPDKENLPQKNLNEYFNRVQKMGIIGYPKFLINKFYWTNHDGSFGWGTEGGPDFINQTTRPYSSNFGGLLRRFYWPLGDLSWAFYTLAQLIWITATILLVLSFQSIEELSLITKNWLYLSIIGANVFLLLFEAGRSRFLIQFLPVLIIVIANALDFLVSKSSDE
ncbi:hypothetical protein EQ827_08560 [Lactobacillus bombi]|nr:hypothetical protein [Bombilactobacillus bombi]